ncbi:kinase-like domain-containing protein [Aspergillus coremiiformis]|uniref:Kinase-like domain-containing protein n=1 Tax=Aspergillus coremiiformis TaxID=138285 RepID=A0A5N6ZJ85_9EURO|nr:kinase-like domain-containing protein [Aspergillus coremiiformis]
MTTTNQPTIPVPSEYEDFFRYTSGRWLWDEEQQLSARYKVFDPIALQKVAAESVGSNSCASMRKLAEGGYNKVFRLLMNDGKTVMARIPNPNAGPPFYTTASEVATMEFVRTILQLPVPKVYGWSTSSENPVGSEYIIMEEAVGKQLESVWDRLRPESKLAIMRELVSIEEKLVSFSFSHFGNLYFKSDAVEGAVPAEIISDVPLELKEKVSKLFTIGPSVEREFWQKERSKMEVNRGPWLSPLDYARSVANREIAWIGKYAVPKAQDDPLPASVAQNDPEVHINLLKKHLTVAPYLLDIDKQLTRSTLWHADLHSSNIFVDREHISAVIDWQGAWAGPLFLQAKPSPIFDYQGPMVLKRPDNFDTLDDERKTQIKQQISKSTLFQLYLLETRERNALLAEAFHLDHGKTRRLPFEFAGDTWDDDVVSFREALINVERYWRELCASEDCPIHFTEAELKSHLQDAEGWNEVQDFFDGIDHLVKRDGWTSAETYDEAFAFFSKLREVGLRNMKGGNRERFEKETRWAAKTT